MLKKCFDMYRSFRESTARVMSGFVPAWLTEWLSYNRERIALAASIFWLAGCCLWIYRFINMDVAPYGDWIMIMENTKEAIIFAFFGIFGGIFLLLFVFFVIKFIYNLFQGGLNSLFPVQWYSFARVSGYLILLMFAFSYIENIKRVGVTAYSQARHVLEVSEMDDEETAKNLRRFLGYMDKFRRR